ncbi:P-loop containing nucleoside triphosphate hydrolase protein [Xylaria cf. heliscus]|nr:P-loop containing nucleoside triphosphate hydrolase protein [Xylaria cf. heliscus]
MASKLKGSFKPRKTDLVVAVMGMTGAGKSTFISLCTNQPVKIGHNLQSCTQQVEVYKCCWNSDVDIYLLDTPGFDDTGLSDTDVLRAIASWLTESYIKNIKVNGMVYMHRITDPRVGGSAKKNLCMFKKLCGPDAIRNVLLVTTMWENVDPTTGHNREQELILTTDFWGLLMEQGAEITQHENNRESAMRILTHFIDKKGTTMAIQKEMADDGKQLHETGAGRELESELIAKTERIQKDLDETKEMLKEAKEHGAEAKKQLQEHSAQITEKLNQVMRERQELQSSMARMHESNAERVRMLEEQQRVANGNAMHWQAVSAAKVADLEGKLREHNKSSTAKVGRLEKRLEDSKAKYREERESNGLLERRLEDSKAKYRDERESYGRLERKLEDTTARYKDENNRLRGERNELRHRRKHRS